MSTHDDIPGFNTALIQVQYLDGVPWVDANEIVAWMKLCAPYMDMSGRSPSEVVTIMADYLQNALASE